MVSVPPRSSFSNRSGFLPALIARKEQQRGAGHIPPRAFGPVSRGVPTSRIKIASLKVPGKLLIKRSGTAEAVTRIQAS